MLLQQLTSKSAATRQFWLCPNRTSDVWTGIVVTKLPLGSRKELAKIVLSVGSISFHEDFRGDRGGIELHEVNHDLEPCPRPTSSGGIQGRPGSSAAASGRRRCGGPSARVVRTRDLQVRPALRTRSGRCDVWVRPCRAIASGQAGPHTSQRLSVGPAIKTRVGAHVANFLQCLRFRAQQADSCMCGRGDEVAHEDQKASEQWSHPPPCKPKSFQTLRLPAPFLLERLGQVASRARRPTVRRLGAFIEQLGRAKLTLHV